MNRSGKLVRTVVHAAWRRRFLMTIAVVSMSGVGILAAQLLPKSYTASTLMLLQEGEKDDILPERQARAEERIQERIAGLQALLKSDLVLKKALRDVDRQAYADPVRRESDLVALRANLSLDLVGVDFLKFQLKGSSGRDLGRQLTAVTTRFLETLLPGQPGLTALQVVAAEQDASVKRAQSQVEWLREKLNQSLPGGLQTNTEQLAALEAEIDRMRQDLARLPAPRETHSDDLLNAGELASRWRRAWSFVATDLPSRWLDPAGTSSPPSNKVAAAAQDVDGARRALNEEIAQRSEDAAVLRRSIADQAQTERDLQSAERALAEAQDNRSSSTKRYGLMSRTTSILNAPERILIIDPARDPAHPTIPKIAYVLAGLVSGLMLAFGLAVAAELLDPVLRDIDDFIRLASKPVLARLPHCPGDAGEVAA